jgi:hypothetical protein
VGRRHVDFSAHIQTVHEETNPRYFAQLTEFERRTGCPVLVNTSFNVRGEPNLWSARQRMRSGASWEPTWTCSPSGTATYASRSRTRRSGRTMSRRSSLPEGRGYSVGLPPDCCVSQCASATALTQVAVSSRCTSP